MKAGPEALLINAIPMIITTTQTVPGREVTQLLGLVKGSSIQTRHIGSHILAGLKLLVGGEIKGYGVAIATAREEATKRMLAEAERLGADAVVAMSFSTSQIMDGAAEIMAYGTAVKLG